MPLLQLGRDYYDSIAARLLCVGRESHDSRAKSRGVPVAVATQCNRCMRESAVLAIQDVCRQSGSLWLLGIGADVRSIRHGAERRRHRGWKHVAQYTGDRPTDRPTERRASAGRIVHRTFDKADSTLRCRYCCERLWVNSNEPDVTTSGNSQR